MKRTNLSRALLIVAIALATCGLCVTVWQSGKMWAGIFRGEIYTAGDPVSLLSWTALIGLLCAPFCLTILAARICECGIRWLRQSARIMAFLWIIYPTVCIGALYLYTKQRDADSSDVKALASYQELTPGVQVIVTLRVGISADGIDLDSSKFKLEQEGTLAWISKDSIGIIIQRHGRSTRIIYAGRMIRAIRVEKQPKAPEPTPPSVTDRAGARSAPAGVVAHL